MVAQMIQIAWSNVNQKLGKIIKMKNNKISELQPNNTKQKKSSYFYIDFFHYVN